MTTLPNIFLTLGFLFFVFVSPICAEPEPAPPASTLIVEPHMVQIILNDEHRQGVDWEAIVSDFQAVSLKNDITPQDKQVNISLGTVSDEDYAVLLDALDAVGQVVQVKIEPINLTENEHARIDFTSQAKNKMWVDAQLVQSTKGVNQLHVSMGLDNGLTGETTVDIKEKTTIVIGSFISEHEVATLHKFPLLGDLPIVGLVFRKKGKLMQKVETIIFLTPKG